MGGFCLTAIKIHNPNDECTAVYTIKGIEWNVLLGCLICVMGFALIGIASDALGDEWRDAPPPKNSNKNRIHNLVTKGPYGIIRHPIYCGLLLEALGSNVVGAFSSHIAVVALGSVTAAYVIQLQQEERELNKLLDGLYDRVYKKIARYKLVPFLY